MAGILIWLSRLPLPEDADWILRLWVALILMGVTAIGVFWYTHLRGRGRRRRARVARALRWPLLREWGLPVGFVLAGVLLLCADGVGWLYDMAGLSGARRLGGGEVVMTQGRTVVPPTPITCRSATLCVHGCQP
ncbi:TPA: hypothetical protein ACGQS5_004779 [Serratia liquefaciens]